MKRSIFHARLSPGTSKGQRAASLFAWLALFAAAAAAPLVADARVSKADSDAMQRKILEIVQNSGVPAVPSTTRTTPATGTAAPAGTVPRARQTPILEREVNSYLRYELREEVPAGVIDPLITIVGDGRVTGTATVDLDEVKKAQGSRSSSGGLFDPMSYVGGRLPVTATGTLQTQNGTGRFQLESASISGVPVPKTVLQQVVSYYSRTPENPSGLNLDDAFELPARIREIRVQPGQAIVVQ